jgi:hypothetical protein
MKHKYLLTLVVAAAAATLALPQPERTPAPSAAPDAVADLAALGGEPAADAVVALARRVLQTGDADAATRFVGALRSRRGHASARALALFTAHPSSALRESVLHAIADLGLRVEDTLRGVRAARTDRDADVRAAAYSAIGALGDAADVPVLLADLSSSDARIVRAAYGALHAITGMKLADRPLLWRQWWRDTNKAAPEALRRALDVLDRGGDATAVADARGLIERTGWMDVAAVRTRVTAWIDSGNDRQRIEGYGLATKLRLGDVAENVRWSLRFDHGAAVRAAAVECAVALGALDRAALPRPR